MGLLIGIRVVRTSNKDSERGSSFGRCGIKVLTNFVSYFHILSVKLVIKRINENKRNKSWEFSTLERVSTGVGRWPISPHW